VGRDDPILGATVVVSCPIVETVMRGRSNHQGRSGKRGESFFNTGDTVQEQSLQHVGAGVPWVRQRSCGGSGWRRPPPPGLTLDAGAAKVSVLPEADHLPAVPGPACVRALSRRARSAEGVDSSDWGAHAPIAHHLRGARES
jgi:hypothetical protein